MNKLQLILALGSASLFLAACGGSSSGPGTGSSSSSSSSSGSSASCETNLPSFVACTEGDTADIYTISGAITEDFTIDMSATKEWRLQGTVTVGTGNTTTVNNDDDVAAVRAAGVELVIEPGVSVGAYDDAKLIVTRGSTINAAGTAAMPITFSSVADADFDGEGEWGGIVVQGFAPQYGAGNTGACFGSGTTCNVDGEGGDDIGVYGGNDEADNSGVIRYVRIAEGGLVAGPDNEVNGLTLQGVGYGTTVEYVQVHGNLDDGIEWFGGTVNVKYAVLTNNDDDDIDFDEGYVGNIQHAIVLKNQTKIAPTGSNDPRGIEANSSDEDYVPQTNAVLANVTVIGGPVNNADGNEQPGMRLRGSLTATVYNSVVEGFDTGCIRIDDSDIDGEGAGTEIVDSTVSLYNVLGNCADGFYDKRDADVAENAVGTTVTFDAAYAVTEATASLPSAVEIAAVGNSGFTFDATDYIGAVAPGTDAANAWWAGWTLPGTLADVAEVVLPDETPDFVTCADSVCTITGSILQDYTLVPSVEWRIDGTVTVGNGNTTTVSNDDDVAALRDAGVTLTINPGVSVGAFDDGKLIITRGSKIMAEGLSYAPITFSSVADADYDGIGEWGGLVVQGFAPQYGAGNTGACYGAGTTCNVDGEGGDDIGVYGGNDPADNSGVIRYVRIAEGGLVAGPDNEVNGLTLQGVGHGTTVEYVQVHGNQDDGIEWFGGTVNVKYAVLTNNDDDDLDYDEGFQGNIQHVIVRKDPNKADPTGSNDPRGIEANSSDEDYVPQTMAVLSNITLIGSDISDSNWGMRLRGAVTTAIHNSAIIDFDNGCVRIDDADIDGSGAGDVIEASDITFNNVIGNCDAGFYTHETADTESGTVGAQTFTLDAAWAIAEAVGQLDAAVEVTAQDNGSDFEFDATDYIGAVEPGTTAAEAWWAGWILPGTLDQ